MTRGENRFRRFFDDAVPFAAIVALALPPAGYRPALLTNEFTLGLRHPRWSPFEHSMAANSEQFKNGDEARWKHPDRSGIVSP
jgi:hypothetical protein